MLYPPALLAPVAILACVRPPAPAPLASCPACLPLLPTEQVALWTSFRSRPEKQGSLQYSKSLRQSEAAGQPTARAGHAPGRSKSVAADQQGASMLSRRCRLPPAALRAVPPRARAALPRQPLGPPGLRRARAAAAGVQGGVEGSGHRLHTWSSGAGIAPPAGLAPQRARTCCRSRLLASSSNALSRAAASALALCRASATAVQKRAAERRACSRPASSRAAASVAAAAGVGIAAVALLLQVGAAAGESSSGRTRSGAGFAAGAQQGDMASRELVGWMDRQGRGPGRWGSANLRRVRPPWASVGQREGSRRSGGGSCQLHVAL